MKKKTIAEAKITKDDEVKFILSSTKGGATQRMVKTTKLPTSLEELRALEKANDDKQT